MDTYGDMVTLLLTFFVMLYSFSSVNTQKWGNLVTALSDSGNGVLTGSAGIAEKSHSSSEGQDSKKVGAKANSEVSEEEMNDMQNKIKSSANLYAQIKSYIDSNNLSKDVSASRVDAEILIRFSNNVLFDSGEATVKPGAYTIVNEISNAINTYESSIEMIRIEGHTDNLPISNSEFASNWELSTDRAVNVLRYLIEKDHVSPTILSAVGYGEYHPIADNNVEDGRKMNRRVDFVITVTK
jgi:Flagellar motor protein